MGVHGMDAKRRLHDPQLLEAETGSAIIEAGRRLVVVADHTKWGVIGSTRSRGSTGGCAGHRLRPRRRGLRTRRARGWIAPTTAPSWWIVDPRPAPRATRWSAYPTRSPYRRRMSEPGQRGRQAPHRRLQPARPASGSWCPPHGPRGRGWAPRRAEPRASGPRTTRLLPVPRQPAGRAAQPRVHRHVRVHQRLRGAATRHADDPRRRRADPRRGRARHLPGGVLLAAPRPDAGADGRAEVRRSSTCGRSRPPSSADGSAGSGVREPRRGDGRQQPAPARPDLGRTALPTRPRAGRLPAALRGDWPPLLLDYALRRRGGPRVVEQRTTGSRWCRSGRSGRSRRC